MKILIAAFFVFVFALTAGSVPKIAPNEARVFVYGNGTFETPRGIPELDGYYCLVTPLGASGGMEVHCAPAPKLI